LAVAVASKSIRVYALLLTTATTQTIQIL